MIRTAIGPTIAELLRKRGHTLPMIPEFDYVKAGVVDSLGLLGFVLELEDRLNISLTDDDIASDRFRTVGGLINIIEEKLR